MPKTKASKAKEIHTKTDPVSLILPYLYLGPCSATSATSSFVTGQGITHIISVGKRPSLTHDGVTYLRLSIEDDPSAKLNKPGGDALAFITKAREGGKSSKIFVHCSAGISRSPAIVVFYLMKGCGMSLRRALGLVVSARPIACPNPGFISQLMQLEIELRGSSSLPPDMTSLPSKKEERLAFFQEDHIDGVDSEPSKSNSLQTSESDKENSHDEPDDH